MRILHEIPGKKQFNYVLIISYFCIFVHFRFVEDSHEKSQLVTRAIHYITIIIILIMNSNNVYIFVVITIIIIIIIIIIIVIVLIIIIIIIIKIIARQTTFPMS